MKLRLACPDDFRFLPAVCSHGFFMLAPNRWEPAEASLSTIMALDDERAVEVSIRAAAQGVEAVSRSSLSRAETGIARERQAHAAPR